MNDAISSPVGSASKTFFLYFLHTHLRTQLNLYAFHHHFQLGKPYVFLFPETPLNHNSFIIYLLFPYYGLHTSFRRHGGGVGVLKAFREKEHA